MIIDNIKDIINEFFEIDYELISIETDFCNDLDFDSLDFIDLAMSVEDYFEIELPDEELGNIKTVGDLVEFIENNIK